MAYVQYTPCLGHQSYPYNPMDASSFLETPDFISPATYQAPSNFSLLAKDACFVDTTGASSGDEFLVMEKKSFLEMMMEKVKLHGDSVSRAAIDLYQTSKNIKDLAVLYKEFGVQGKILEKVYNGKKYIILKGRPGLRTVFTGTRYLSSNTKMITHGIGSVAGQKIMSGSTVTIMFVVAADIIEFALRDTMTWKEFGVGLASNVVKALIATVVAAGIVVGISVGWVLNHLDEKYQITEAIAGWIEQGLIAAYDSLVSTGELIISGAVLLTETTFKVIDTVDEALDATEEWTARFKKFVVGGSWF